MGTLLKFSPRATTHNPDAGKRAGTAKIILFTGIRYERDGSAALVQASHKIKKRRKG